MNISNLGIKKIHQLLKSRSLSVGELQRSFLDRLDKTKDLNCFVTTTGTLSVNQWKNTKQRFKKGSPASSLDGIPIAIKDNFCVKNVRTSCASAMLESFIPSYNSTVYQRLEDKGVVLMGKTNLDQFGMGSGTVDSIFGPTKNPWSKADEWRITGGSSGGSAAAVAAGACVAAIGSDTGGSVRNPASYCGLVGFKPSYGLVSRHGLIPLVNSMDVPGILTKSIEDCVEIFNVVAGSDDKDSTTIKQEFKPISLDENYSIKDLKIGIPIEYHCEGLDEEKLEIWRVIANLMEKSGAKLHQLSMPYTRSSIFVYSILNQCEVSSNMSRYDGIEFGYRDLKEKRSTEKLYEMTRAHGFNNAVKNRILSGNYFLLRKNYEKYFQKALKVRRLIANDFERAFNKFDLLLTPTTLSDAPLLEDFKKASNRDQSAIQDFFTQPANMAGVPAVSIPIKLSKNGLPLSLQLMAPHGEEEKLLNTAKWIENAVQFQHLL